MWVRLVVAAIATVVAGTEQTAVSKLDELESIDDAIEMQETTRSQLQQDIAAAVAREEYSTAADLQDKLTALLSAPASVQTIKTAGPARNSNPEDIWVQGSDTDPIPLAEFRPTRHPCLRPLPDVPVLLREPAWRKAVRQMSIAVSNIVVDAPFDE